MNKKIVIGLLSIGALYFFSQKRKAVQQMELPVLDPQDSGLTTAQKRISLYEVMKGYSGLMSKKYKLPAALFELFSQMLPGEIDIFFDYTFKYLRNGIPLEPGTAFYADLSIVNNKYGILSRFNNTPI